jgi:hypothetical protein
MGLAVEGNMTLLDDGSTPNQVIAHGASVILPQDHVAAGTLCTGRGRPQCPRTQAASPEPAAEVGGMDALGDALGRSASMPEAIR